MDRFFYFSIVCVNKENVVCSDVFAIFPTI